MDLMILTGQGRPACSKVKDRLVGGGRKIVLDIVRPSFATSPAGPASTQPSSLSCA
jgi:hypothetical protein